MDLQQCCKIWNTTVNAHWLARMQKHSTHNLLASKGSAGLSTLVFFNFFCFQASLWRSCRCVFLTLFNIPCFRASFWRFCRCVFLSPFNISCFGLACWGSIGMSPWVSSTFLASRLVSEDSAIVSWVWSTFPASGVAFEDSAGVSS